MNALYHLCFKPIYQHYIWGGDKIPKKYQRDIPPGVYAESWEISDRHDGMSVVANGALAGRTLAEIIHTHGADLLVAGFDRFPLLIKIIDARETLSVQVHPDDRSAAQYGGEAKTEMWYVLEAEPHACVYSGFKPGTSTGNFKNALAEDTVENLLERIPVQAGDTIFTPRGAGSRHRRRLSPVGSSAKLQYDLQNV